MKAPPLPACSTLAFINLEFRMIRLLVQIWDVTRRMADSYLAYTQHPVVKAFLQRHLPKCT